MIARRPHRSRDDLIVCVRRPRVRESTPRRSHRLSCDDSCCSPDDRTSTPLDRAIDSYVGPAGHAGIVRRPRLRPMIVRRPRCQSPDRIGFVRRPRSPPRIGIRPRRPSRSPPHRAPAPPLVLLAFAVRAGAITARRGAPVRPQRPMPFGTHVKRDAPPAVHQIRQAVRSKGGSLTRSTAPSIMPWGSSPQATQSARFPAASVTISA